MPFAKIIYILFKMHVVSTFHCRYYISSCQYTVCGVKPIIHQSELRTYAKVIPFKENSSFRFVVLGEGEKGRYLP
jgi:hypothetical protein